MLWVDWGELEYQSKEGWIAIWGGGIVIQGKLQFMEGDADGDPRRGG